jgi:tRNA threonylcarbamoyladenosine dehydratase
VGSWAAESIARSGVGEITLVDFDQICVTNANRQLHALAGVVGKQKTDVMADRLRQINPRAKIHTMTKFYSAEEADAIFARRPAYVIDGINHMTAKAHLLVYCLTHQIPVITATGSGGRMDPTYVRIADLAETSVDPLARELRKILRQKYGFPTQEGVSFGIPAVYSMEPYRMPVELHYDGGKGFRCVCPNGDNPYFNCEKRNVIMGNASFVTGTLGLVCASHVVRELLLPST